MKMVYKVLIAATLGWLLAPGLAHAQVIVLQTSHGVFTASPDPTLTSYDIEIVTSGTPTQTTVFTRNVGKPTMSPTPCWTPSGDVPPPCADVLIGWTAAQYAALPQGNYVLVTVSNGPNGPGRSVPSVPFAVPAPTPSQTVPSGKPVVVR